MLIKVDISKIAKDIAARVPTKDDRDRLVQALGAAAVAYWKREAQRGLKSTSRDYIAGIQEEFDQGKYTITLKGTLPNIIEQGFRGGDMRDWMLKSPKARKGRNGRYLIIPFRHGTPGTSGRNVGPAMPTSIHAAAKHLEPSLSRHKAQAPQSKSIRYGERLGPKSKRVNAEAKQILTSKKKSWHATSIFSGMIREQKTYAKATQSQYMTFRVISEGVIRGKTDKEGKATQHWFHPGISAKHYAQKTQAHISKLAAAMLPKVTKDR